MPSRLNTATSEVRRSAVPVVKALDLRDINNTVAAIDQQLRVLNAQVNEANLKAGQAQLQNSQGVGSLLQIQQQLASLQSALAAVAGFSAEVTLRADATVALYDAVYPTSNGGVSPVDTQDLTAVFAVTGIATSPASAGGTLTVRRFGPVDVPGSDFEIGRAVYAQVGSGLTQFPNYASVALPVGVAVSSTVLEVRPAYPALNVAAQYSDGYDDFVPVTLMLVRQVLDFVNSIFGQEDGIMVKVGGQIVTREIVSPSGSGTNVTNGDGVFGNPSIT